jgi:hypothetical protein
MTPGSEAFGFDARRFLFGMPLGSSSTVRKESAKVRRKKRKTGPAL